jgi:hypothetical protein
MEKKIKKNSGKKGPPFKPDEEMPTKPDKDPDPTKHTINDPQKTDPTRIKEPAKTDPTRIDNAPHKTKRNQPGK